ncbi:MAG TPA: DUF3106 domain-containing protein [Polaromonas sp.]|jgi:hypothetical protein|nr:DUF3106 domain-containing protein [Polaromonas sp.]HQS92467.1 DUF3106 domain-containing protein [Polaromonas sp.]
MTPADSSHCPQQQPTRVPTQSAETAAPGTPFKAQKVATMRGPQTWGLWQLLAGSVFLATSATSFSQPAQPAKPAPAARKHVAAATPAKPVVSRPVWAELTVQQQQALRPLSSDWDTISEAQKRKWLEISRSYPSLTPEEQNTLHSRMIGWVGLSAQQRAQARLNFARTKELSKQLTPEERKAKWQTYQALSAEEKRILAAKARPKPTGAATAVRPVAPQKLAVITPLPGPHSTGAPHNPAAVQVRQTGDPAELARSLTGTGSATAKP